jgi:transcription termination/antitermination protein NusG
MGRGGRIFRLGDTVRILAGPFAAFTGRVEGINRAKSLLKVSVEIFGRETPVRVAFREADKIGFTGLGRHSPPPPPQ